MQPNTQHCPLGGSLLIRGAAASLLDDSRNRLCRDHASGSFKYSSSVPGSSQGQSFDPYFTISAPWREERTLLTSATNESCVASTWMGARAHFREQRLPTSCLGLCLLMNRSWPSSIVNALTTALLRSP